jgi:protocatechuate 3,4-dioxygenase beta subunit
MKSITRLVLIIVILLVGVGIVGAQDAPASDLPQFNDRVEAVGDVLILYGHVVDMNGNPLAGVRVEIWQTDANGTYDHPNAPADGFDTNFQHYGSAITDENGAYVFRTVIPAPEMGRPLHIHVKVKQDGLELLTTQFYFTDDLSAAQKDNIFQELGDSAASVLLELTPITDTQGATIQTATKDLVIATADVTSGTLMATPRQTEGPFYPVVNVGEYDNDLAVVSPQNNPAYTVAQTAPAVSFTLINLNTATADELLTIPNMSNRMVREFEEYRPYVSITQFRREIGKYVDDAQIAAYEQYVYVPIQINDSDAETLKQIPGVDDTIAAALIAARPFASNQAFLTALGSILSPDEVALAAYYLVADV